MENYLRINSRIDRVSMITAPPSTARSALKVSPLIVIVLVIRPVSCRKLNTYMDVVTNSDADHPVVLWNREDDFNPYAYLHDLYFFFGYYTLTLLFPAEQFRTQHLQKFIIIADSTSIILEISRTILVGWQTYEI